MVSIAARRLGRALGSYAVSGVARVVGAIAGSRMMRESEGMNPTLGQRGLRHPARPLDLTLHSMLLGLLRVLPGIRGRERLEEVSFREENR